MSKLASLRFERGMKVPLRDHPLLVTTTAAVVALSSGCGDPLPDETFVGEPLYTVRGRAKLEAPAPGSGVLPSIVAPRLSLLWSVGAPVADDERRTAQARAIDELELEPTFPLAFSFELFEPPADDMVFTVDGTWLDVEFDHNGVPYSFPAGLRVAAAELLIYEDRNANQAMDPVSDTATDPVDWILGGASDRPRLIYIPDAEAAKLGTGAPFVAGFNLLDASSEGIAEITMSQTTTRWEDRWRQSRFCATNRSILAEVFDQVAWDDLPPVYDLGRCTPDGRAFELTGSHTYQVAPAVCADWRLDYYYQALCALAPAEVPPTGWPCPIP